MVEKELTPLLGWVKTTRADAAREFKASQPFIDSCAAYYGDGFEDCLKQIKSSYLHLDLSKITMDDPLPSTPVSNTLLEEIDNPTESEPDPKDDSVVLAQPVASPSITLLVPSTEPLHVESPFAQDVQDLPLKGDGNPQDAPASLTQLFIFNDYSTIYLDQFLDNVKCPFVFGPLFL